MKEAGKGTNLLLPLGIGAGLLLLLTSMKKKDGQEAKAVSTDAPELPLVTASEATAPQIDPAPAPKYNSEAMTKSVQEQGDDEEDTTGQEDEPDNGSDQDEGADDNDDDEQSYSTANRSSSGGSSYTPYQPSSSSINTNRQSVSLPATNNPASNYRQLPATTLLNSRTKWGAVNPKSLRFQSDQAKQFAARQKIRSINPLVIGKGKPRMGVPIPVSIRPGATSIVPQPIVIASQPPTTIQQTPAPVQATIFPLKFGSRSPYVKEVQRKIGVTATGYFGTQTRAALQKKFNAAEISEALYKQIITGRIQVIPVVRKPMAKAIHKVRKPLPKKAKIIRRK